MPCSHQSHPVAWSTRPPPPAVSSGFSHQCPSLLQRAKANAWMVRFPPLLGSRVSSRDTCEHSAQHPGCFPGTRGSSCCHIVPPCVALGLEGVLCPAALVSGFSPDPGEQPRVPGREGWWGWTPVHPLPETKGAPTWAASASLGEGDRPQSPQGPLWLRGGPGKSFLVSGRVAGETDANSSWLFQEKPSETGKMPKMVLLDKTGFPAPLPPAPRPGRDPLNGRERERAHGAAECLDCPLFWVPVLGGGGGGVLERKW